MSAPKIPVRDYVITLPVTTYEAQPVLRALEYALGSDDINTDDMGPIRWVHARLTNLLKEKRGLYGT